jgi:tetratricopeptide (TPR) repeat protein
MRTLVLIIALFTAWTAQAQSDASVVTFGNTDAQLCYNAAQVANISSGTLDHCNAALKHRALSRQDRIATLVNRGIVFNHRKDFTAAFADFEAALALDPDTSAAYVNRGNTHFSLKQFDLAIDDYSTSLRMDPRDPYIAHYNRGLANEARREAQLAFADFVRVTELRPGWEPAVNRVEQYRAKGFVKSD